MTKRRKRPASEEANFDVDAAVAALLDAVFDEDSRQQRRLFSWWKPVRSNERPDARVVALTHLHGIEADGCRRRPCRIAGLCHALYEIVLYRDELRNEAIYLTAAGQLELVERGLTVEKRRLDSIVNALDIGNGVEPPPRAVSVRQRALGFAEIAERLAASVHELTDDCRRTIWSPELRQPVLDRRRDRLLLAVWQHLRDGGLSFEEIARLVPDRHGDTGRAERIRKRIERSLEEDHGDGVSHSRAILPREWLDRSETTKHAPTPPTASTSKRPSATRTSAKRQRRN